MREHIKITTKFHNTLQALLARKSRHICMYPACKEQAIHAHAISKEHALRCIAEDGLLVHPEPIRDDKETFREIKLTEVGINKATTFQGFCAKHDAKFSTLDKLGINTVSDVFLQLYRSFAYIVFEDMAYRASARHAGDNETFNDALELAKPISARRALALSYDLIEGYSNANDKLPDGDRLELTLSSINAGMDAKVLIKKINCSYPVALQKKYVLREDEKFFDTFVFIIPSESRTTILILCHPKHVDLLLGKIRTPIKTLNFIESCMISDGHWWIAPSVMKKWPKEKLQLIEEDYWNFHERKFLEDYDISIFDEIRVKLCDSLPNNEKEQELEKIKKLPTRDSIELRRATFIVKTEQDKRRIQKHHPNEATE